jgi:hypothetical protein
MYIWILNRISRFPGLKMKRLPLAIFVLLPLLGGCAQLPDWAQPLRWVDAAVRGDDLDEDKSEPPPGADDPYPNLADVPKRPDTVLTLEEQKRLQAELEAERKKAIETDKALRERTS